MPQQQQHILFTITVRLHEIVDTFRHDFKVKP